MCFRDRSFARTARGAGVCWNLGGACVGKAASVVPVLRKSGRERWTNLTRSGEGPARRGLVGGAPVSTHCGDQRIRSPVEPQGISERMVTIKRLERVGKTIFH